MSHEQNYQESDSYQDFVKLFDNRENIDWFNLTDSEIEQYNKKRSDLISTITNVFKATESIDSSKTSTINCGSKKPVANVDITVTQVQNKDKTYSILDQLNNDDILRKLDINFFVTTFINSKQYNHQEPCHYLSQRLFALHRIITYVMPEYNFEYNFRKLSALKELFESLNLSQLVGNKEFHRLFYNKYFDKKDSYDITMVTSLFNITETKYKDPYVTQGAFLHVIGNIQMLENCGLIQSPFELSVSHYIDSIYENIGMYFEKSKKFRKHTTGGVSNEVKTEDGEEKYLAAASFVHDNQYERHHYEPHKTPPLNKYVTRVNDAIVHINQLLCPHFHIYFRLNVKEDDVIAYFKRIVQEIDDIPELLYNDSDVLQSILPKNE